MHCPLQNGENAEVLLDYCARKLSPAATLELERHMQSCGDCRSFAGGQQHVWSALDSWEAQPVSPAFDRKLYSRIEEFESRNWLRRWMGDGFAWRPALSFGAACAALTVMFVVQAPVKQSVAPQYHETTKVEVEPEQVERALEDLEMLKQLSISNTQNL